MNASFLKTPREKFGRFFFNRDHGKVMRQRAVYNLETAKTIGLLYDATDEKEYHTICEFVKSLQNDNKTVKALGYLNYNIIPHYCIPKLSFDYFIMKDISLFYIPNNTFIEDFLKNDFDLLIDLTTKDFFPIQYIAGMSKAKFKVGRDGVNHSNYFDFMLNVNESISLNEYISQICKYLTLLNKTNE